MIKLIGTTHLMKKAEIIDILDREKPEAIGVEMCQTRFDILISGQVQKSNQEDTSIMGKISNAIKKKAEEEKIEYGSDMINASRYALEKKIPLVLVDRPIEQVNSLMQKIPENEQIGFMKELQDFQNKSIRDSTKEVSEEETIKNLKTNYPIAYEFLIVSRELHIVKEILKAQAKYPDKKILVFLGKGHVNTISKEIGLE